MRLEGDELVSLLAEPSSVAVVGASADPTRLSGRPLDYLARLGYKGRLYAVNPRVDLPGVPTYREVGALPAGDVDVAMVALPAPAVLGALRDAEAIGVKAAVVIGSGFEDRKDAARRELDEFAASSQMRIIGPNCVGTLGVPASAYLTFSSVLQQDVPQPGRIGLVTQSGALGNSLLQTLIRRHVGLHQWFSTGNEVDTGAIELTTGLLSSPGVDAVGVFLEGVTDREWLRRLEAVIASTGKPLFVLKAAQSDSGRQAAAGHTGRIVGSSDASDAILREMGVRLVSSVGELADALVVAEVSRSLSACSRPRVSLVSVSGAAGVIGADQVAQDERVRMAAPVSDVQLDPRLLPANPLDVPFIGETNVFCETLVAVSASGGTDVVVGVESSLAHDREELTAKLSAAVPVGPVILTSLSEDDAIPAALTLELSSAGIAYLPSVERAVAAIAAVSRPQADHHGAPVAHAAEGAAGGHRADGGLCGLEAIAAVLPDETPWAPFRVWSEADDDASVIEDLGFPLVVKAAGRTIAHRTELGAVRVVRTPSEFTTAVTAVSEVCAEHGDVPVVQAFAPPGFELLVSVIADPEFGPVAFLAPGGTLAELMSVRTAVWAGWHADRRLEVLRSSRIGELLGGYRGGAVYDLAALSGLVGDCLDAVDRGDLDFVELNPVIVHTQGVTLVDAIGRASTTITTGRTP